MKKTYFAFSTKQEQESAKDFLLKKNVPFRASSKKNWIEVAPRNYVNNHLDVYLTPVHSFSTFTPKIK